MAAMALLAACGNPTDAQKEAIKFRELCAKNPQIQECKDWKDSTTGGPN